MVGWGSRRHFDELNPCLHTPNLEMLAVKVQSRVHAPAAKVQSRVHAPAAKVQNRVHAPAAKVQSRVYMRCPREMV
jgi:hypothetical protein